MTLPPAVVPILAMQRYPSFWEWITALHNIKFLLLAAAVAAFVIAVYRIARDSPLRMAYWSGLFVVCLLPLVFGAAAAVAEYVRLGGDWKSYFPSLAAATFVHIAIFGTVLSAIATTFYSYQHRSPKA
jgi:hypothetical protein